MRRKTNTFKTDKGFSLLELLIVMVILGLLAGLVGPKFFKQEEKGRQKTAKSQIALFETAIDTFRLDAGKFPTTEQGLQSLRVKPDGMDKWDGPYLPKDVPLDPWGNPYVYKYPGEHGDYDILSYGADGAPGGEGVNTDIVSWKDI